MSRTDSPLRERMIFSVGARRSGTFWLQRIVTAHPEIVEIPSETALFSHGIAPLFERFTHSARGFPQVGQIYVERATLLDAARDFCDRVFLGFDDPGSRYIAERTPQHLAHLELMAEIYPDARYLHIVRDGRDVARSLVSMPWGPSSIEEAATEWRTSVMAARVPGLPERYREVRYEALLAEPEERISDLYEWLGLEVTPSVLESALRVSRMQRNEVVSGSRVRAGKWKGGLSPKDVETFNRVAGDVLVELGYSLDPSRPPRERRAAGRLPRARGGRRSSRIAAPPARRAATAERRDRPVARILSGIQEFLSAIHQQRFERMLEMMDADCELRIISCDGDRVLASNHAMVEALRNDSVFYGRQIRGDIHTALPASTVILRYALADGTTADRILVLSFRDELVIRLVVYHAALDLPAPRAEPAITPPA